MSVEWFSIWVIMAFFTVLWLYLEIKIFEKVKDDPKKKRLSSVYSGIAMILVGSIVVMALFMQLDFIFNFLLIIPMIPVVLGLWLVSHGLKMNIIKKKLMRKHRKGVARRK